MRDKKLVLLIGLSLAAVSSLLYGILMPSKAKQGGGPPVGSNPSAVSAASVPLRRHARRSAYQGWGRNPFSREEIPAPGDVPLHLEGIVWDAKSPTAVVNGRLLAVGDEIGGKKVADIRPESVVVTEGTVETELKLGRKR